MLAEMKPASKPLVALIVALTLVSAQVASAHHSFSAEYDANRPASITGKVVEITLVNPHSAMFVNVTGVDGKTTKWFVAMDGVIRGFALKAGDQVTVSGFLAKDNSPRMALRKVVRLSDGWMCATGGSTVIAPGGCNTTPSLTVLTPAR
jgi:hypothetical protein